MISRNVKSIADNVRLRCVEQADLPMLYQFQLDANSNQMAFTHPRSKSDFDAHWANALQDSNVVAKAVVVDGEFAGCISCFKCDGVDSIGYWVGSDFWGQGIATNALRLLLEEVPIRPLHSRVAVENIASFRVLQKCGFQETGREWSSATERYVECEEVIMKLMD